MHTKGAALLIFFVLQLLCHIRESTETYIGAISAGGSGAVVDIV